MTDVGAAVGAVAMFAAAAVVGAAVWLFCCAALALAAWVLERRRR
ncbi:hypothetical protein [Slackia faecicanis]|nr:hypothetical protein [Slackia faecicanis]